MNSLQREFIINVKLNKQVLLKKKENLKRKEIIKVGGMQRKWGSSIDLLNRLNEKQMIEEITYLRNTTHPRRQVRDANGIIEDHNLPIKEL